MENIILIIHVILAFLLIISVLLQRSDGGALGIGSGSETLMSSRSAGDFLTKFTTIIAVLFIITSISLTIINKKDQNPSSVLDEIEKKDSKEKNLPKIPKSN
tara:strand:- start:201 stop:506 length:306 start_codon:yes stop_codon:yes gene_type:complete